MFKYKVFRQLSDHSFLEIAQTTFLSDAETILGNWHSGIISEIGGANIKTKNLTHLSDATLI